MKLPDLLKTLRKRANLTQLQLAIDSELSLATIQNSEKAKANPRINTLAKIADALGYEIIYKKIR